MRISSFQIYNRALDGILDQQSGIDRLQRQLSSGKCFSLPSEAPVEAAQVLSLQERAARVEKYQNNIVQARNRLGLEESAVSAAVDVMQRVRELAVQGLNDTNSKADREAIAAELRLKLDELLEIANTRDPNGEYLFAGAQSRTRPFSHNGTGTFTYAGDQTVREVKISDTRKVAMGHSGTEVFLAAPGSGKSAFSVLYTLITDMEAGNPQGSSLDDIDAVLNNLLGVQAEIGARMQVLDAQESINEDYLLGVEIARSRIQDTDFASASIEFQRRLTALQAAQQAFVKVNGLSLFNYL